MVVSLDVCEVTWSELLCIMMRVLLRRPRAAGANRNDTLLASVYACQQQSFNSNGAAFKAALYQAVQQLRPAKRPARLSHAPPELTP